MNYSTVDFMEVRKLVLQHELEPGPHARLDDSDLFRASNEVIRAKVAICDLRERATVINRRLNFSSQLDNLQLQQFEERGSIWFDEAIFSELLCMIPIAVSRCPDILYPEILVHAVLTTKHAGSLLKACLIYIPMLRKQCIELLADFISKYERISCANTCYKPPDPLLFYCLQQSFSIMESFYQSDRQLTSILREALVQRCICANIIIQMTVEVLKDVVDFISRIFFSDAEICQWIVSCIRSRKRTSEGFSSSEVEKLSLKEPLTSNHWAYTSQIKEATVLQMCKTLHEGAEASFHEDRWSSRLYCHLKLYCVLVHLCDLQPTHEEVIFWFHALTFKVDSLGCNDKSPAGKSLIHKRSFELGVTFLFLVPGFRGSSLIEKLFREGIHFFLGPAISGLVPYEQGLVTPVWLVVQLLLQCCARVSEYCSKVIGMNIKIASTCWEDVCCVAHEIGITSDMISVVKAASSLPPTGPICSTKSDQLVLECLLQLLKSGHFVRYRVNITESIENCILFSAEPIHPMMVQIIEMFAEASCPPTSVDSSDTHKLQPLPCSFLIAAIKPFCSCFMLLESTPGKETGAMSSFYESTDGTNHPHNFIRTESAVPAILASFYVLCREKLHQSREHFSSNFGHILTHTNNEEMSWSRLLRSLPVDKLLSYMESHHLSYAHIYPQWVGLAMFLFPERFHVAHLVQRVEEPAGDFIFKQEFYQFEGQMDMHDDVLPHKNRENKCGVNHFDRNFSIELAHQVFRNSLIDSVPAIKLLKAIRVGKMPARNELELQISAIEDMLPLLLDRSCADSLQEAFCAWWYGLDQANIEFLVPLFYQCIAISSVDIDKGSSMKMHFVGSSSDNVEMLSASNLYQELVEQPLSILACRTEIYQTPLISILLDILMHLIVRNRRMCLLALMNAGEVKKEETLKALDTRDSAVCQILLENWSRMSPLSIAADSVLKVGSLICGFISSLFYSSPSVFRLVHFRGYDMKLIPAVSKGVTLMIHFLEFFEDSLKFLDLSVLPFTIILLSNIIRRYPGHSRSLSAAQKAVMHVRCIDLELAIDLLGEIVEPVAWFAITFPSLEPEVREFLEGYLRAIDTGKISAGVNVEGFRSSALSALTLLAKGGQDRT